VSTRSSLFDSSFHSLVMSGFDLVSIFFAMKRSKFAKKHLDTSLAYTAFAVVCLFASKVLSDRSFSALITLSAALQTFGFCLLRIQVRGEKGVNGVSSRTLQMYLAAYCVRLYSTLQYNGYLPTDRSGDWVYQLCDIVALCMVISMLYSIHSTHERTYQKELDSCPIHFFLIGCFVLSCFVHPHLNNRQIPDIAWTVALYIEAVAMVPQLWMMTRKGGEVDSLCSHYIACVFFARILMMVFWGNSYPELTPKGGSYNVPGYGVMGAQMLQVAIFGDFMWMYFKSIRDQKKLVLPTSYSI